LLTSGGSLSEKLLLLLIEGLLAALVAPSRVSIAGRGLLRRLELLLVAA